MDDINKSCLIEINLAENKMKILRCRPNEDPSKFTVCEKKSLS